MTEQELRTSITPCIMAGNTWFVFEQIKAYADAETKELEEAYAELKSIYDKFYESDAVQHKQILALNAEIKRLREFAQQCFKSPEKLAVIHYFENGEFDYCDLVPLQDAATNALSPAPVTEGKFPSLLESDVLPPNHFMGMGDDGKPFIGEISTGNSKPVTETIETESPCRLYLRVRSTIQGYCRTCDTDFNQE